MGTVFRIAPAACRTMDMDHAQQTDRVRLQVAETLRSLGQPCEPPLRESILIRGGFYCGRRFETEEAQAVWFLEENQLKFYDRDGALLLVSGVERPQPQELVARAA